MASSSDHDDNPIPVGLPVPNPTASFWHSEPSTVLLNHRTTPELPSSADIVIVGSGITGTSIARYLSEDKRANGLSIVMLEAREACSCATGRNGGHCQPLLFERSAQVAAFELKNVAAVKAYIDEHNIPCEWRNVSGCRTFWTEPLLEQAEHDLAKLRDASPDLASHVKIIRDKEELAKHKVSPECSGATLTTGAGSLWPYKYVAFILEKLIKDQKLNLQTNTPATAIESAGDNTTSTYTVSTPRGAIKASTVILATNAYTSYLLPDFADLIVPCRGEMSALLPPKGSDLLPNSYGFVGALSQPSNCDDYLIQRPFLSVPNPAGHLMFGGGRGSATHSTIGAWDDSIIDEGMAGYLRAALLKVLQLGGEIDSVAELTATHQWTGIMGYSRDNNPWVGKVPGSGDGLWLCGGYTGHGMPNGTLCGKAVVQMVLAEREGLDVKASAEKLVADGDLPPEYVLSAERIQRARLWPTVAVVDKEELWGDLDSGFFKITREGKVDWTS